MIQQEQQENGFPKIVIHRPSPEKKMVLEGYPWKALDAFYQELVTSGLPCEPLRDLVKAIAASPSASILHATTSHTDLLVFGYSPCEVNREMLKIEYLSQGKHFLFTYREHPWSGRPWRKSCDANEGKAVFEHLIIHLLIPICVP